LVSPWWLEICYGEGIYTRETRKCYTSGPLPQEPVVKNLPAHHRVYLTLYTDLKGRKGEKQGMGMVTGSIIQHHLPRSVLGMLIIIKGKN
jgi:hypothetical protein